MFGLSTKEKEERAKETLHLATKVVLIGGFFHANQADEFGLNEEASACLYTEVLAHQIYVLIVISNQKLVKRYGWATEFAIGEINKAISNHEIREGFIPGSIGSLVFQRCFEMDSLSPQERHNGEHYRQSARKIKEFDSRADEERIVERLATVAREYFDITVKKFK